MTPRPDDETREEDEKKQLLVPLSQQEEERAVASLQNLIRFPTVSATAAEDGSYLKCAEWLVQQLENLNVLQDIHVLPESPHHSPVVVACWKGEEPELPVILLNSHYDVVPAVQKDWSVNPFEGLIVNDRIYGRGTQDMKCVCVQYIEALRKLASLDYCPHRSIYLTFVPDEEVGGSGMAAFLESKLYQQLPGIALALDEGLASTTSTYSVFYGERLPWWIDVTATGPTGHGSRFLENTAVEQLLELSRKAMEFREGQRKKLGMTKHDGCAHAVAAKTTLGDVTSLNITTLEAGVRVGNTFAYNCVPPTAKCSMDIRISPHQEPSDVKQMLDGWCRECGTDLNWKYIAETGNDLQTHAITATTNNPWYSVFQDTLNECGLSVSPQVFPAATDSRFLRALGIRALGFSPMRNTEILLHEVDEYIPRSTFLEGICVYVQLIQALASQTKDVDNIVVE